MTQVVAADGGGLHFGGLAPDLATLLRRTVERCPQHEAIVDIGSSVRMTYRQVWDAAARVAGGLVAAGVIPGDRVVVRLPNGVDWCLAVLGAALAGATPVPVNTRLVPAEIAELVADSGATVVIDGMLPDAAPRGLPDASADDPGAMFYTSGTTGRAKAAVLSHRALLSAAEQCRRALHLEPDEPTRNLIAAPLFHVLACGMQWIPALASGGCAVIMPGFEVGAWLAAIRHERIDVLNGVPAMYWQALRHPSFTELDAHNIRLVSYGAAPTPPAQVLALRSAFPAARLAPGYGLTEAPCVTGLDDADAEAHADSVGTAVDATELELLADDGSRSATGIGQLLVRGPQVMSGYWRRPEATAATLVDGWLHTGDIVRIDGSGRVHLLDRRADLINRGGENVYSVEVERALAAFASIAEIAIVGVPDDMLGQKVGAVVVPRAGEQVEPAALLAFAREQVAAFKVPQYVLLQDDPLPRNAAGKVDKAALRARDWASSEIARARA